LALAESVGKGCRPQRDRLLLQRNKTFDTHYRPVELSGFWGGEILFYFFYFFLDIVLDTGYRVSDRAFSHAA
jgi:hypothetical protein